MYTYALIQSGARRNKIVDANEYVWDCWSCAPSARRVKEMNSQETPIIMTQENPFRNRMAREIWARVRIPKRTENATAAEKEGEYAHCALQASGGT